MRSLQPPGGSRGRIWAGCLLLARRGRRLAATGQARSRRAAAPATVAASRTRRRAGEAGTPRARSPGRVFPATSTGPDPTRTCSATASSRPDPRSSITSRSSTDSKQSAAFSIYAHRRDRDDRRRARSCCCWAGQKPTDIGAWAQLPRRRAAAVDDHPRRQGHHRAVHHQRAAAGHSGRPHRRPGRGGRRAQEELRGRPVVQNYRIVVPIELRVPGALHAALQVQSISTGFSDPFNPFGSRLGHGFLHGRQHRQRPAERAQAVTVTGPFGQAATVHPPQLQTILPGDSIRVSVALSGLFPVGPMTANVASSSRAGPRRRSGCRSRRRTRPAARRCSRSRGRSSA